jgi:hypothetical protein
MEAANLGAWLAAHPDPAIVERAVAALRTVDSYLAGHPEGSDAFCQTVSAYLAAAQTVVSKFHPPSGEPGLSLAVPTWFYGHEPSNLFAPAIAKYFDNSIREEGLLALATRGVVFAPGSAGTQQEIFQDLTQNHYATYGMRSPMVLFGAQRYQAEHRLLLDMAARSKPDEQYADLIGLLDDEDQVVDFLEQHPPRPVD